jgi:cytochrome c peroxidase
MKRAYTRSPMRIAALCANVVYAAACSSNPAPAPAPALAIKSPNTTLRVPELGPVPETAPVFADDPVTSDKLALGTTIFFDARLSGSKNIACNGCHLAATLFQDNVAAAKPSRPGAKLPRSTLSFDNLIFAPLSRWDGALGEPILGTTHSPATDLLETIVFPFAEPNMDLGTDVESAKIALKRRLTQDLPGYVGAYQKAFGEDITSQSPDAIWRLTGRALRTLVAQAISRDSAFDRWNAGDDAAMPESAVRGLAVFRGKGRCIACHSGPFLTDFGFHNLSTSLPGPDGKRKDEGRYYLTQVEADRGRFLTPTLRGVYDTGPYFHDGLLPSGVTAGGLSDVIGFLNSPQVAADPNHDPVFSSPLGLKQAESDDLLAFLKALRGARSPTILPPASFP